MRPEGVFALAVAAAGGHLVYPAGLAVATRGRSIASPPPPAEWPALSVVVPAYLEAGVIAAKIDDLRANGYPAEVEIIVVADGDPETAAAARAAGARVLDPAERLGKAQALNAGVAAACHPIVVLTDANNCLAPGALAALVPWFSDPAVGAVAGEKRETESADGEEGLYWRFESWLKRREAVLGTTVGLVGELAAVRRAAWEPIPADVAIDDLWLALDLPSRGYRVAYEMAATATEPPAPLRAEWDRRTRNVAGALHVLWRRRRELGPGGGLVAAEAWGHRLWRYTGGPAAHAALLAHAVQRCRSNPVAQLFLVGHGLALAGLAWRAGDRPLRQPFAAAADALFLQCVALAGLVRYGRGYRGVMWSTPER